MIKIGDKVIWCGGWGTEPPKEVTVKQIELGETERSKYGIPVDEVSLEDKDKCCFTFVEVENWAYGYQVTPL